MGSYIDSYIPFSNTRIHDIIIHGSRSLDMKMCESLHPKEQRIPFILQYCLLHIYFYNLWKKMYTKNWNVNTLSRLMTLLTSSLHRETLSEAYERDPWYHLLHYEPHHYHPQLMKQIYLYYTIMRWMTVTPKEVHRLGALNVITSSLRFSF